MGEVLSSGRMHLIPPLPHPHLQQQGGGGIALGAAESRESTLHRLSILVQRSVGWAAIPLHQGQNLARLNRASWGEKHRQVGHTALTSSRGPEGASLTSGSCLPLASRMVMMELGMCAC